MNESLGSVGKTIPCFGPQGRPFSDLKGFGVLQTEGGDWSAVAACPEIWVETKAERKENSFQIATRFIGLKNDLPLFFTFYVRADGAEIGGESFAPRSLQRYAGPARSVIFDETLEIVATGPGKMELIPLSGDETFFGCFFLLAFEIPLCEPNLLFDFTTRSLAGKISAELR